MTALKGTMPGPCMRCGGLGGVCSLRCPRLVCGPFGWGWHGDVTPERSALFETLPQERAVTR